ncbi:integrase [Mycobacterium tuberculosis RGTB327]|nr:integrase [Mycobacterium tuberculosis RGTB327]
MSLADEKRLALATVAGDVDLATPQGRLVARLKGSVAAHETEHKKARQRRAARQKAERGHPNWSKAFGYLPGPTARPGPSTSRRFSGSAPKASQLPHRNPVSCTGTRR